jgi:hypothetical protein
LDFTNEGCDLDAFDTFLYKRRGNFCLWFTYISLTEQKLAIQV